MNHDSVTVLWALLEFVPVREPSGKVLRRRASAAAAATSKGLVQKRLEPSVSRRLDASRRYNAAAI